MERWTIAESHADRFRMHINFGGRGFWCMFDYEVTPAPGREGMEIVTRADADAETVRWFPDLKRGMEAGWLMLQEHHARLLTRMRVEVTKIHTHPLDTSSQGCERYGSLFIEQLGRYRAVRESSSARPRKRVRSQYQRYRHIRTVPNSF